MSLESKLTSMTLSTATTEPEQLSITDLHSHPLQGHYYDATSAADLDRLAADMQAHGQRDAVHVMPPDNAAGLPAFTIMDGHRRVEAARRLCWTTVQVIVRHDLVTADRATVEATFIRFNFERRQLHSLDQAACLLRLLQLDKGTDGLRPGSSDESAARDQIGAILNKSGRHLQRLYRILLLPREIQKLVRDGLLLMVTAEKLETLSAEKREELALKIAGLTDKKAIRAIVLPYLPCPRASTQELTRACTRLMRELERALSILGSRANKVSSDLCAAHLPTFTKAQCLIAKLEAVGKSHDPDAMLKRLAALSSGADKEKSQRE